MIPNTKFKDRFGREWDLALDFAICRRIDASDFSEVEGEDGKFSILNPKQETLFKLLLSNTGLLFSIIWVIIQEQVEAQHAAGSFPISPKEDLARAEAEFAKGINGPVIKAAREAFVNAVSDFFPDLQTVLSTWATQASMVREKVEQKIHRMNPTVEKLVDMELDKGIEKLIAELEKTHDAKPGDTSSVSPPTPVSPTEISSHPATPSAAS